MNLILEKVLEMTNDHLNNKKIISFILEKIHKFTSANATRAVSFDYCGFPLGRKN